MKRVVCNHLSLLFRLVHIPICKNFLQLYFSIFKAKSSTKFHGKTFNLALIICFLGGCYSIYFHDLLLRYNIMQLFYLFVTLISNYLRIESSTYNKTFFNKLAHSTVQYKFAQKFITFDNCQHIQMY